MSDTLLYLELTCEQMGLIQGESTVAGFKRQIEIESFKWGMSVGDVKQTVAGREGSAVHCAPLDLVGYFDLSSVNVMLALKNRDKIKTATLSLIHALQPKDKPSHLLRLDISGGYVEDMQFDVESGKAAKLKASLKLSYKQLVFEYFPASTDRSSHRTKGIPFQATAREEAS